MHRPDTPRPPSAPPVVPPPLPEELPQLASPGRVSLFFARLVRDVKIGGVCLLLGLLVGQSGLLDRDHRPSSTVASLVPEQAEITASANPAIEQRPSQQTRAADVSQNSGGQADQAERVITWKESPEIPSLLTTESPAAELLASAAQSAEPEEVAEPTVAETTVADSTVAESTVAETLLADNSANSSEASPFSSESAPPSQTADSSPPLIASSSVAASIKSMMTLASQPSVLHPSSEDVTCQEMESHGTLLKWADTPADAYRVANEQEKLVFMIHVSGNFEIPGFT